MRERTVGASEAEELMECLMDAHYKAASNNSISKYVFHASFEGSGDPSKAIAAALLSTGGKHGPLTQARQLVMMFEKDEERTKSHIAFLLENKQKVPGFGNSFFKTSIDPSFDRVYDRYREAFSVVDNKAPSENPIFRLWWAFLRIKFPGRSEKVALYPNAALITGAVLELCGAPPHAEHWIFVAGRTRAWIESLSS